MNIDNNIVSNTESDSNKKINVYNIFLTHIYFEYDLYFQNKDQRSVLLEVSDSDINIYIYIASNARQYNLEHKID